MSWVSRSQVSKFAGDRETCSSPSAARQTCFASIRRWNSCDSVVSEDGCVDHERGSDLGVRASLGSCRTWHRWDLVPGGAIVDLGAPTYVSGAEGPERIA